MNIAVAQSGGPTCAINASLVGVFKQAVKTPQIDAVFGSLNGIEGIINDQLIDLKLVIKTNEDMELLRQTPSTVLGSCRYKLPDVEEGGETYERILNCLEKHRIEAFFYIGGNDSMDTVSKLSRYAEMVGSDICFLGIPKTIDNDLVNTDHTPGFGSAAKYVASTVREIAVDASVYDNKKSVTIVEIMGRHAGWLTAASALARKFEGDNPVLIYLPEVAFDTERFIQDVSASLEKVSNVIVCISEGINDGKGTFICELASEVGVDTFGHKMLTGSGKYLENLIKDRLGVKVRSVELNVSQRCSSAMLSATDLQEAVDSGAYGVKCALHGESGKMIAFVRADGEEYKLSYEAKDVNEICNREKGVPAGWITKDGSDVSDEFIRYAKPLIQGEVQVPQQDGLPLFAYRK